MKAAVRAVALAAAVGLAAAAPAQSLPPSPAEQAEAAVPVRVVCIADRADAFVGDARFRERVLARLARASPELAARPEALVVPLGLRYLVGVGSGFVVDPERRHVVTSWQVASACGGPPRQLGVIEPGGATGSALLAERLPDRAVNLVQALCRDPRERCDAELPPLPGASPLAEAERRRQLDQLLTYAPDLAVLRLPQPLRTLPLLLAMNQPLDDQMRLVVRGYVDAAADAAPASAPALYTGPQQFSALPPGGQPGDEIHARLHRLSMRVQPALGGSPVLRGDGVVGVLSVMLDEAAAAGDATGAGRSHAVPVTVLAGFLDLLEVPWRASAVELLARGSEQPRPQAAPALAEAQAAAPAAPAGADPKPLMLAGAVLLALVAAASFWVVMRRSRAARAAPAPMPPLATVALPPQRTVSRVDPTLLHAVAMPTSAVESGLDSLVDPPAPPAQAHLRLAAGPLAGAVYTLPMPDGGCSMTLGRDPRRCQVVFPPKATQVSGVHAEIVWSPESATLTLRDFSSSGTWVNGDRVEPGATIGLSAGDEVDLGGPGQHRFGIDIAAPAPPGA